MSKFLRKKSKAFDKLNIYKNIIELQAEKNINKIQNDGGGEFFSTEFKKFCKDASIERQITNLKRPEQNETARRTNKTLLKMARSRTVPV